MQLLHPFMPFATEEIYHRLKERKEGDDLTVKRIKDLGIQNKKILAQGLILKEVITSIRDARTKTGLSQRIRLGFTSKLQIFLLTRISKTFWKNKSMQ